MFARKIRVEYEQSDRRLLILKASNASLICHPDRTSNASGRKDLGQLRVSEAGSGL